jgi:ribonuclease D
MTPNHEQMPLPIEAEEAAAPVQPHSISRDALILLPVQCYRGPVDVIDTDDAVPDAIAHLEKETLLGFDTETKPVFKPGISYPPALVQLAGEHRAYIFQLQKLTHLDALVRIFTNPRIIKAGIALADDLKKLQEVRAFTAAGFAEVGDLARKLGITQTGLRSLAGLILGYRVSKREQRSNWARPQLSPSQITYAATDAWVSRELYLALTARLAAK